MKQNWDVVVTTLGAKDLLVAEYVYKKILIQYWSKGRYHHNFDHIGYMIEKITEIYINTYNHRNELLLSLMHYAAYFHDVVYTPSNSKRDIPDSILSAIKSAIDMEIPMKSNDFYMTICGLIYITENHEIDKNLNIEESTQAIFLDADNSILSAPSEIYDRYANNIAKEYSCFGDLFKSGRMQFLNGVLSKKNIFLTEYMKNTYEEAAIKNIKREIACLSN